MGSKVYKFQTKTFDTQVYGLTHPIVAWLGCLHSPGRICKSAVVAPRAGRQSAQNESVHITRAMIQSGKIQNNIYILNFTALFYAEFHFLQDKRAGLSKKFLLFSTLFLYIPCLNYVYIFYYFHLIPSYLFRHFWALKK